MLWMWQMNVVMFCLVFISDTTNEILPEDETTEIIVQNHDIAEKTKTQCTAHKWNFHNCCISQQWFTIYGVLMQWAELSFCTGTGQPHPPQSPAALQVGSGEPKARVLTWHLGMGTWISSMKSPSGMHDSRGSESTCPGPSRFSTVVNSLERDGLRQAFLP